MTEIPEFMRRLDAIAGGFQRAKVLFTALSGGVFFLLETPMRAEEAAQKLGWDPRGTRMLLNGLIALELVDKDAQGRYHNAPIAAECLIPGAPMDQTHILSHKANGWDAWSQLDELVRTGKPYPRGSRGNEELRAFICGMKNIAAESAKAMVEAVDISAFRNMLDVGGGPGTYSHACLRKTPGMRATVFDLPEVIPITKEEAASAGLLDRMDFVEGDMTKDALGSGYDLVLLSNIIHSFGPEMNRLLVKKCFDALIPGGMLIVKDFLLDPDGKGPAFSLMFALHMFVHTEAGDTFSVDTVREWTRDAGFQEGKLLDLTPQTRMWLVTK